MQPPQGPPPGYGPPPAYPPAPGYPAAPGYPGAGPAPRQPGPWPHPGPGHPGPGYPAPGYAGPGPGHPGPGHPGPWQPPPPPALSPAGQPLASFVDRLLAYLIDIAIFVGVSLVLAVPVFAVFVIAFVPGLAEQANSDGTLADPAPWPFILALLGIELGYVVLLMLFYYLYYVEFQLRKNGQTVGKQAMKVRVVPIDPAGTLTRGVLAKRFLVQGVAGSLIPFFSYLDGFWQLWDKPYQQCLHDKFAQTVVVKVNT